MFVFIGCNNWNAQWKRLHNLAAGGDISKASAERAELCSTHLC